MAESREEALSTREVSGGKQALTGQGLPEKPISTGFRQGQVLPAALKSHHLLGRAVPHTEAAGIQHLAYIWIQQNVNNSSFFPANAVQGL